MGGIISWLTAPSLHPYDYVPLSERRQIRLAKIEVVAVPSRSGQAAVLPRTSQGLLRATLETVSLDDLQRPYIAISYACGDPQKTEKILCAPNTFIAVTPAAATCLSNIASGVECYFWMDTLCIDQSNDVEKAQQIRLMSDIFANAKMTMGWLGPPSEEQAMPVEFIYELQDKVKASIVRRQPLGVQDFSNTPSEEEKWAALALFLENPFFQRAWIIQEIVLSEQFILTDGSHVIAWDVMAEVVFMIQGTGLTTYLMGNQEGKNLAVSQGVAGIVASHMIRLRRREKRPHSLIECISQCRYLRATDPRDKVFALIAMASDGSDPAFEPRYGNVTPEEVYTSTARRMLEGPSPDATLLYGAGIGSTRALSNLPSWVPDLSAVELYGIFGEMAKTARYRASGTRHDLNVVCDMGEMERIRIRGQIIDQSAKLIRTAPMPDPTHPSATQNQQHAISLLKWLQELRDLFPPAHSYPSGSEFFPIVIARSLIANNLAMGQPTTSDCLKIFNNWMEVNRVEASQDFEMFEAMDRDTTARKFDDSWTYSKRFVTAARVRRFFCTARGYLGLGPPGTEERDELCIFIGMAVPFLIRKREAGGYYLVGECYVDGLMDGEGLELGKEQDIFLY